MPSTEPPFNTLQDEQQNLLSALAAVLQPVAKLCLSKSVPIQAVEELVRRIYVETAAQSSGENKATRLTSRISMMTGLTRREVSRIQNLPPEAAPVSTRSVALDVLTSWCTRAEYVNKKGLPTVLARTGNEPSFEALARDVTQDVHPRSILSEMQRLNMVMHHSDNDTVRVLDAVFVPRQDASAMLSFMASNVGEHLQACVENLLGDGRQHFEQSLLADELSAHSLEAAKSLITVQWHQLLTELGPQLQALMDADVAQGRPQDQQLRLGLYSYMRPMSEPLPVNTNFPAKKEERGTHD